MALRFIHVLTVLALVLSATYRTAFASIDDNSHSLRKAKALYETCKLEWFNTGATTQECESYFSGFISGYVAGTSHFIESLPNTIKRELDLTTDLSGTICWHDYKAKVRRRAELLSRVRTAPRRHGDLDHEILIFSFIETYENERFSDRIDAYEVIVHGLQLNFPCVKIKN